MNTQLKPELKAQIDKESEDGAIESSGGYCQLNNHSFDCGCSAYEEGYAAAGDKYALKWQQAEEMMEKMAKEIEAAWNNRSDGRITTGYIERLKRFLIEYGNYKQKK